MSVTEFLNSPSGKGTVGVVLAAVLFAWPPALSWVVAVVALLFGCWHLREAFRRLEGTTSNTEVILEDRQPVVTFPVRTESPACDMDAVVAAIAAPKRR
jgi:hypothetical protein